MADLDERHATPLDRLLDETWRILAHEDLLRLNRPVTGKPDRWLAAKVNELRKRHDAEARMVVEAQPQITARRLADRLRAGPPPAPSTSRDPGFDRAAGLDHVRALRARLNDGGPAR